MPAPVLFVSHGAPDIALQAGSPILQTWGQIGKQLPRPQAILLLSAHWETASPVLSTATTPSTIHDFGGFPRPLYQLQYPAPGAPQLANAVADCLNQAGIPLALDPKRGLDHGAWIPLRTIYPDADIPVAQLSVQPQAGTNWHWRLGQALQPLRADNILIMASGAVTHNFGWLSEQTEPHPQALAFSDWLGEKLAERDTESLLAYRYRSASGAVAHPSEEHLLPLYVALGASTAQDRLTRFTPGFTYGALAMDAYLWE